MNQLRTIILVVLATFAFGTSANAQVEAKVTLGFNISGTGWEKVVRYGTPVTIFAYRHKSKVYSFGIYTDDYAGIIDLKINPFDVEEKLLKKLPNAQGKNATEILSEYYKKACVKAREKAFAGKYRTTAPVSLHSYRYSSYSVLKKDSIAIIGYKVLYDILYGRPYYQYAIVNNNSAGVFESSPTDNIKIELPLGFLPSTDDPQVEAIIDKENSRILARMEAERKAREEEKQRLAAEKKAREEKQLAEEKARLYSLYLEEQKEKIAHLQTLAPAFIEMTGWNMDSAGGIAVNIRFTNCSSQKVKYVYFRGYFLNAVGDKCRNNITGSTEWKYRGVGPISPLPKTPEEMGYAHMESWHFGNPLFYSTIAVRFRLSSVTIEYMNGKKTVLSGAELNKRVAYAY